MLGILATSFLGNMLTGKVVVRSGDRGIPADKGAIATSQGQGKIELVMIFNAASSFK